jgi:hypothetical protein
MGSSQGAEKRRGRASIDGAASDAEGRVAVVVFLLSDMLKQV